MSHSSITLWLGKLRSGDAGAAQPLWEAYFRRLVGLARSKLVGRGRLVADEEDVALSAFKSFCRGLESGRFPNLNDREDLWRLLVTITLHKVLHLVRDETRAKRGGERRAVEVEEALSGLIDQEPSPQLAAQIAEEFDRLLAQLPTPELAELALLKMEGYTNSEIATKWGKAERTVERKLELIRQIWGQADEP